MNMKPEQKGGWWSNLKKGVQKEVNMFKYGSTQTQTTETNKESVGLKLEKDAAPIGEPIVKEDEPTKSLEVPNVIRDSVADGISVFMQNNDIIIKKDTHEKIIEQVYEQIKNSDPKFPEREASSRTQTLLNEMYQISKPELSAEAQAHSETPFVKVPEPIRTKEEYDAEQSRRAAEKVREAAEKEEKAKEEKKLKKAQQKAKEAA